MKTYLGLRTFGTQLRTKGVLFIQQVVNKSIFSRIAAVITSKHAWIILQMEFQGSSKVTTVKLLIMRQEYETLSMKGGETIQEFISRNIEVVNQIRIYGELISNQTVTTKVLRSLTSRFNYIVATIEESVDLIRFTTDELSGSLQTHEARLNQIVGKSEEKAFQVKNDTSKARWLISTSIEDMVEGLAEEGCQAKAEKRVLSKEYPSMIIGRTRVIYTVTIANVMDI